MIVAKHHERILKDSEVKEILREVSEDFSPIKQKLEDRLPTLVNWILNLSRKESEIYPLSNYYPQDVFTGCSVPLNYEEISYEANKGALYIIGLDPNTAESGESYTKRIPANEFLEWAKGDFSRIVDIYQHIQSALEQPKDKTGDNGRDSDGFC